MQAEEEPDIWDLKSWNKGLLLSPGIYWCLRDCSVDVKKHHGQGKSCQKKAFIEASYSKPKLHMKYSGGKLWPFAFLFVLDYYFPRDLYKN